MGNINGPEESGSRGNFAFCTLALPMIALEAKGNIDNFFEILDKYIQLSHDYLLDRFNMICQKHVYNYPFSMGQHLYMGSEKLRDNDTIFEALKNSSLSIGFVGLAECLTSLIGKHHGESPQAQQLGLLIIKHIRAMTDKYIQQDHLNWSTFATPAESCAGRLCKLARKKFGIVQGVTDRDYYTNSNHVPVYYHCSPRHKAEIEAPYHPLTLGGHIFYVEVDGDATQNPQAIMDIVDLMDEYNIGYGSVNHNRNRCMDCGYEDASEGLTECPVCHSHNIDTLQRITGYLVGTTDRWNSGKLAELHDRIVHK